MKRNYENDVEMIASVRGQSFGDFKIITPFKVFAVSKAELITRSKYFYREILGKKIFELEIIEEELPRLKLMLLLLHDRSDEEIIKNFKDEDFFKFYDMSKSRFECDQQMINNFFKLYFEVKKIDFTQAITEEKYRFLKPSANFAELTKNIVYNAHTSDKFKVFVKNTFKSIHDCCLIKNEFRKLPYNAIIFILGDDDFITDTENSVFYLLMGWLNAQKEIQPTDQELDDIFKLLKWNDFSPLFFENILEPALAHKYGMMNRPFLQYYTQEYVCRAGKKKALHIEHRKRLDDIKSKKTMVKTRITIDIEKLKNENFYGSPVLINGYLFTFFIQMRKDQPEGIGSLNGFIKCTSCIERKDYDLPLKEGYDNNGVRVRYDHQLPMRISFRIIKRDDTEKVFAPMPLVYSNFGAAIGGNLTTPAEMEQFLAHGPETPCDLLRDTANQKSELVLIGAIEFLDSDEIPVGMQVLHTEPWLPLI